MSSSLLDTLSQLPYVAAGKRPRKAERYQHVSGEGVKQVIVFTRVQPTFGMPYFKAKISGHESTYRYVVRLIEREGAIQVCTPKGRYKKSKETGIIKWSVGSMFPTLDELKSVLDDYVVDQCIETACTCSRSAERIAELFIALSEPKTNPKKALEKAVQGMCSNRFNIPIIVNEMYRMYFEELSRRN